MGGMPTVVKMVLQMNHTSWSLRALPDADGFRDGIPEDEENQHQNQQTEADGEMDCVHVHSLARLFRSLPASSAKGRHGHPNFDRLVPGQGQRFKPGLPFGAKGGGGRWVLSHVGRVCNSQRAVGFAVVNIGQREVGERRCRERHDATDQRHGGERGLDFHGVRASRRRSSVEADRFTVHRRRRRHSQQSAAPKPSSVLGVGSGIAGTVCASTGLRPVCAYCCWFSSTTAPLTGVTS